MISPIGHPKGAKHKSNGHAAAEAVSITSQVEVDADGIISTGSPSVAGGASSLSRQGSVLVPVEPEAKNKKAVAVVNRVRDKLTGRDFDPDVQLEVHDQVDKLIKQATSHENLCQCYIGWCPFW